MTEQEREELIEKMVRAMWYIEPNNNTLMIDELARAALAVAEPVIREQCAEDAAAVAKERFDKRLARAVAAAIREGGDD